MVLHGLCDARGKAFHCTVFSDVCSQSANAVYAGWQLLICHTKSIPLECHTACVLICHYLHAWYNNNKGETKQSSSDASQLNLVITLHNIFQSEYLHLIST